MTSIHASSFRRLTAAVVASAVASAIALLGAVAARADDLVRVPIASGSLVGTFLAPADGKRHPAIVVLGGSEGGLHDEQARVLAEHGYAALALAYYGIDPLPKQLAAIPVETVTRGIDWLVARPEVDATRIGVLGTSKGGELALLAATREPRIRATAALVPSAYVWFGLAFGSGPETSSWSAGGAPVAYIPSDPAADAAVGQAFGTGGTISYRDTFDASYAAAPAAVRDRATIPVEKIAGPVLCIAGGDDRNWDSPNACRIVHERRHAAGRDAKDESFVEPGAGHALPFSGRPAPRSFPAGLATLVLGGTPEANGRAGADARDRVIAFFNRTLGAP
ncbi:MAG TPA: acyl-CoA thioester hydrolase/BAAT C-terminal domain-containing protein [Candidatus Elarobacter sp.]